MEPSNAVVAVAEEGEVAHEAGVVEQRSLPLPLPLTVRALAAAVLVPDLEEVLRLGSLG